MVDDEAIRKMILRSVRIVYAPHLVKAKIFIFPFVIQNVLSLSM